MTSVRLCAFADEASESIEEQILALNRNSIELIELRNADGKNVADFDFEHARRIKSKLNASGISVWSIGSPIGKSKIEDDFAFEEKRLNHILDLCEIFDCQRIRIFSFFTPEYEKHRLEVISRLTKLCAIAKKRGVRLYHENEKGIYGDIALRVFDLLQSVPNLGSIFDPANYIQCGENTTKALELLLSKTDYFHIKDVKANTGELVPAGYGSAKIEKILESLKGEYVLTVEPHLRVFAGYNQIDNTELKNKFSFETGNAAFDCAAEALRKLLNENDYFEEEEQGIWIKR